MLNLIDVQRASYAGVPATNERHQLRQCRLHAGCRKIFKSVFPENRPIFAGRGQTRSFVYCELEEPKYDVEECIPAGHDLLRAA